MRVVASIAEVIAFLAALLGLYQVFTAITVVEASAIQQAAGITLGIGIAVIPYCVAGIFHRAAVRDQLQRISDR